MDRIKESFDSLPIAACFFDKNGVVRLINRRMLAIANWLRKGGIQSLAEMQSALHTPPANVCCLDLRLRIYRFPDGKALRFAQEQITTKAGVRYTQITAADVTELIRKQNQLKAENAKLAEANERLRRLLMQMPEIIREEETLAMKLRVHDDIGHSILAARRVLLQHTDLKEIRANAALWEQSISVLYRSRQIAAQSEPLETAKKRAEELGVTALKTIKPHVRAGHTTVWTWGSFSGSVTAGWQQTPVHSNQVFDDLRALLNAVHRCPARYDS